MVAVIDSTPRDDGFRMPGEFEPHAGTWLVWPERPETWRLGGKPAQRTMVELAAAIAQFEPVTMCVSSSQFGDARALLPECVRVVEMSTDDAWIRDSGPTFVVNDAGCVRAVDWRFNGWGGKQQWSQDDLVPRKICEIEHIDMYRAPLVAEGGAFHVDGEGTVLAVAECLMDPNRNPGMPRQQAEQHLKEYLGAETVIWLPRGLDPYHTGGHVDVLACFVRPGEVALAWTDDGSDWRHEIVAQAHAILHRAKDARGRSLTIHHVPLPAVARLTEEESSGIDTPAGYDYVLAAGVELGFSYVNHYVCNGAVIAPTFGDPNDQVALKLLDELYPDRLIAAVPAREIAIGGGIIHCVTQQQPAGRARLGPALK